MKSTQYKSTYSRAFARRNYSNFPLQKGVAKHKHMFVGAEICPNVRRREVFN